MELTKDEMYLKGEMASSSDTSVNYSTCNSSNFIRKTDASSDPLDIMKHDPAILEVFLMIDKKENVEEKIPKINEKVVTRANQDEHCKTSGSFEKIVAKIESCLLSLSQDQLALFLDYARELRTQRELHQRQMVCAFCKRSGQSPYGYNGHVLRDRSGRVRCPVLRSLRCPRCSATGDFAHTLKYCPE